MSGSPVPAGDDDSRPPRDDAARPSREDPDTVPPSNADAASPTEDADIAPPSEPDDLAPPNRGEAAAETKATATEPGELLYYEPGGSWWVVAIGPILVGAVLIMEIVGPGQVHWPIMAIFVAIITGFSVVQVFAARKHVSVELTDTTLRQGTRVVPIADIDTVYPPNNGAEPKKWQSAPALGELHGVPRRRKGIGVKLADGTLAQAWAKDVETFRRELTDAHIAVRLGLPPRGND